MALTQNFPGRNRVVLCIAALLLSAAPPTIEAVDLCLLCVAHGAPAAETPQQKPALVLGAHKGHDGTVAADLLDEMGIVYDAPNTVPFAADYTRYGLVVLAGTEYVRPPEGSDFNVAARAYAPEEIETLHRYLSGGGTVLVLEGQILNAFRLPEGADYLASLTGATPLRHEGTLRILMPNHPWTRHLNPKPVAREADDPLDALLTQDESATDTLLGRAVDLAPSEAWKFKWLRETVNLPVRRGENIIGDPAGLSVLTRLRVGKGQLIHVGWRLSPWRLTGESTDDEKDLYGQQHTLLQSIVAECNLTDLKTYMHEAAERIGRDPFAWHRTEGLTSERPGPSSEGEGVEKIELTVSVDDYGAARFYLTSFSEPRQVRFQLSDLATSDGTRLAPGTARLELQKKPERKRLVEALLKAGSDPVYGTMASEEVAAETADWMLMRHGEHGWTKAAWLFELRHVSAFDPEAPNITLSTLENLPVWITTRPSQSAPGRYEGTLTIEIVGERSMEVPVTLVLEETPRPELKAMRPLPQPRERAAGDGPSLYVDARNGDDANVGSEDKPWKTLARAVTRLEPGDALYIRGGIYRENVLVNVSSTEARPITIRSYPGELAIIDGGIADFYENPAEAWEPFPQGAEGEYRSTKTHAGLGSKVILGNFADSMVPLQGYRNRADMRSRNMYGPGTRCRVGMGRDPGLYCGPGIFYDSETERIHIRLAHTLFHALTIGDQYRGTMDPRNVRLIIAGIESKPLWIEDSRHLRIQDLVVRGARGCTMRLSNCEDIEIDHVTVYAGHPAFSASGSRIRIVDSAFRGTSAPWTSRGDQKYRSLDTKLFTAGGYDLELAYCEFTDHHDGLFFGNVDGVDMHHSLADNFNDDGIFLTAGTALDGTTRGGNIRIYQNYISRCLSALAFGIGHGYQKQTGSGVWVYRNVFDMRKPVLYGRPPPPDDPDAEPQRDPNTPWPGSRGRVWGEHGGPMWEPMFIYHNTVFTHRISFRGYYAAGWASHSRRTRRRIFNNIFVQITEMPGLHFPPVSDDFQADANLNWSVAQGPSFTNDFFGDFRASETFARSKAQYPPGWEANGLFADPQFTDLREDWKAQSHFGLCKSSPAVDAGLVLPGDWPDPLGQEDAGRPDLGAFPLGYDPAGIGLYGRLSLHSGDPRGSTRGGPAPPVSWSTNRAPADLPDTPISKRALLIGSSRRSDGTLLQPFLSAEGMLPDAAEGLVDIEHFDEYACVVIGGETDTAYSAEDMEAVESYLTRGGTLLILGGQVGTVFGTPEGKEILQSITGIPAGAGDPTLRIRIPDHPWVKHLATGEQEHRERAAKKEEDLLNMALATDDPLGGIGVPRSEPEDRSSDPASTHPWLSKARSIPVQKGQSVIGSERGLSALYTMPVGEGRLIYVGWSMMAWRPSGDVAPDRQELYEEQVAILKAIVHSIADRSGPGSASVSK